MIFPPPPCFFRSQRAGCASCGVCWTDQVPYDPVSHGSAAALNPPPDHDRAQGPLRHGRRGDPQGLRPTHRDPWSVNGRGRRGDARTPAPGRGHDAARREGEITAFADFPEAHWRKIWSTNPLERLNREVKRRTDVIGIFPNAAALLRLSACVLIGATTSGKSPSAATSPKDRWPSSTRRHPPSWCSTRTRPRR